MWVNGTERTRGKQRLDKGGNGELMQRGGESICYGCGMLCGGGRVRYCTPTAVKPSRAQVRYGSNGTKPASRPGGGGEMATMAVA